MDNSLQQVIVEIQQTNKLLERNNDDFVEQHLYLDQSSKKLDKLIEINDSIDKSLIEIGVAFVDYTKKILDTQERNNKENMQEGERLAAQQRESLTQDSAQQRIQPEPVENNQFERDSSSPGLFSGIIKTLLMAGGIAGLIYAVFGKESLNIVGDAIKKFTDRFRTEILSIFAVANMDKIFTTIGGIGKLFAAGGAIARIGTLFTKFGEIAGAVLRFAKMIPFLGMFIRVFSGPIGWILVIYDIFKRLQANPKFAGIVEKIKSIWVKLEPVFKVLSDLFELLMDKFVNGLAAYLDDMLTGIDKLLSGDLSGVWDILKAPINALLSIFGTSLDTIGEEAKKLFEEGKDYVINQLDKGWQYIIDQIDRLWTSIQNWFSTKIDAFWDWAIGEDSPAPGVYGGKGGAVIIPDVTAIPDTAGASITARTIQSAAATRAADRQAMGQMLAATIDSTNVNIRNENQTNVAVQNRSWYIGGGDPRSGEASFRLLQGQQR